MMDDPFNFIGSMWKKCKRAECACEFEVTRLSREYCSERCRKIDERYRYQVKLKAGVHTSKHIDTKNGLFRVHNKVKFEECLYKIISGIYFLLSSNEIVYIGMTNNVMQRIAKHLTDHGEIFDTVYVKKFTKERGIGKLETAYINRYKPRYNIDGWPEAHRGDI